MFAMTDICCCGHGGVMFSNKSFGPCNTDTLGCNIVDNDGLFCTVLE